MQEFMMQASNPRSIRAFDEDDHDIPDALQTVFPFHTEYAYMIWHYVHIPLGYKYTMSYFLPGVVDVLLRLMEEESGSATNVSPAQEFPAVWYLSWAGDELRIRFEWCLPPSSSPAPFAAHPALSLSKSAFISEWKQVLGVALRALTDAGYTEEHLGDLGRLRRAYESIPEPGVLYRETTE